MAESDRVRQQKVTDRRKESGFKPKKCYFSEYTSDGIEMVAEALGYTVEEQRASENYSFILDYCVSIALDTLKLDVQDELPTNKHSVQLYKLKQIARHRLEKEKDDLASIAQFMKDWGYALPYLVWNSKSGKLTCKQAKAWDEQVVQILLEDKKYQRQVKLLNTHMKKKRDQ
ncbi:hypothetical protein AB4200_13740 [Vibrio kanaloae]|uniref:hypothetical protein n=1 Tax=Vibrio kanaloae TaxID=170673 RepID=UPI0035530664